MSRPLVFFFFNDTATTEIYTLSLHDALPIWQLPGHARRLQYSPQAQGLAPRPERPALPEQGLAGRIRRRPAAADEPEERAARDRKSTRLNSSHLVISYAVFCLKKKRSSTHVHPHRAAADARFRLLPRPTHQEPHLLPDLPAYLQPSVQSGQRVLDDRRAVGAPH